MALHQALRQERAVINQKKKKKKDTLFPASEELIGTDNGKAMTHSEEN